jgi:hypothetical protein
LTGEIATGPLSADRLTLKPRLEAAGVDVGGLAGEGYGGRIDAKLEGSLLLAPPAESLAASRLHFDGAGADLAIPQARLGSFKGSQADSTAGSPARCAAPSRSTFSPAAP